MTIIGTRIEVPRTSFYHHFIVISNTCESWQELQKINTELALKYGPIPSFGNIPDILNVFFGWDKLAIWSFRGGPGFCHARRVLLGEAKIAQLTAERQKTLELAQVN